MLVPGHSHHSVGRVSGISNERLPCRRLARLERDLRQAGEVNSIGSPVHRELFLEPIQGDVDVDGQHIPTAIVGDGAFHPSLGPFDPPALMWHAGDFGGRHENGLSTRRSRHRGHIGHRDGRVSHGYPFWGAAAALREDFCATRCPVDSNRLSATTRRSSLSVGVPVSAPERDQSQHDQKAPHYAPDFRVALVKMTPVAYAIRPAPVSDMSQNHVGSPGVCGPGPSDPIAMKTKERTRVTTPAPSTFEGFIYKDGTLIAPFWIDGR